MAKVKRELKLIEVGGTPSQIGFQYGEACPEIKKMLDLTYKELEGAGLGRAAVAPLVQKYIPPIEEFAPEILDMLRGIAEGAKVGFEEICLLNVWLDIVSRKIMQGGCTSFIASGEATSNGETIIGQNIDWRPARDETLAILKIKPNQGPQSLAITTTVGSLGTMGLNSAGLGVGANLLLHKASVSSHGGVPEVAISTKLLATENMAKAIGVIASAVKISAASATSHPMAVLLASGEGDSANVEAIPDDISVLYPEKGIIARANHFQTDRFKSGDLMVTLAPDTFMRSQRLLTLMTQRYGKLSVDVMKELMQDHNDYPDSVCRHGDKTFPLDQQLKSNATIISNLSEKKTYIAWGNPCENEFTEYKL